MAKPSTLPRWAQTGGGADAVNVVAPTSAQQDTGYATNAVPTSAGLNWIILTIYKWIVYLANLAGESFTWTAGHTFQQAVTLNGEVTIATAPVADTDAARLHEIAAEASARATADANETLARQNADTAEATARANADTAEATARQNADALLMPLAGGTFTGAPKYAADPVGNDELCRKSYVATAANFAASVVSPFQNSTFLNGWLQTGGNLTDTAFCFGYKTHNRCFLEGWIQAGTASKILDAMPAGWRPSGGGKRWWPLVKGNGGFAYGGFDSAGAFQIYGCASGDVVSLHGISYDGW